MRVRVLVVAGAVLACAWALPGSARADYVPADSGSLTITSDFGDFVGGGGSYAYSTPADTFITHGDAYFANGNMVNVQVRPADYPAEHWELSFRAPYGQVLQPGTYTNVVRDNGAL